MTIYEVWESRNGDPFSKLGVYLTDSLAKDRVDNPSKSSHMTEDGWVKDVYEYDIREIDLDKDLVLDIYIRTSKKFYSANGRRIAGLSLEKAEELYNSYSKEYYLDLQLPQRQFGDIGITLIKNNIDDAYKKMLQDYEKKMQEEETWRPGDLPWEAPGMNIRDFF